ncbi:4-diphosphocytidyl-2-C-methyl-D-erythritol kinase [Desulfosarcina sp. BuS5]|uniref:4-(cytidine 5'-diphospho)-2-C-methyl-D-erythritol kinase n=1 Tax=Desulfosarcina sp. BuS5 TaxID=933262 RepID=UPI0006854702|nr:4-(cytidine 5'-diphospho)-2-C-methyl-D-erythritol kinase [Desulfosarcina sp. BuS5]WDN90550.1 4-diphosphocytidyl-2-C-methyl-D-erythritol kinase [Desulfosarcina sp. BuS5]
MIISQEPLIDVSGRIKVFSPAKINLFLHITGKRPDGFHDLVSLMCCINLYDTLYINLGAGKTAVTCTYPGVPLDRQNIALQAASAFLNSIDIYEKVGIHIIKRIPVGAGLGGGSSNAAAVLRALNYYYGYPFSKDELFSIGLSLGADVPFLIFRKPAIVSGIGEKIESFYGLSNRYLLLIYPGFSISTAEVFKKYDLRLTKIKKKIKLKLLLKDKVRIESLLWNDLEEVAVAGYPEISYAKKALLSQGAQGVLMTGSGSAVFGLFSDFRRAKIAHDALSHNINWKLFLTDLIVYQGHDAK